jgi:hypothetical protein
MSEPHTTLAAWLALNSFNPREGVVENKPVELQNVTNGSPRRLELDGSRIIEVLLSLFFSFSKYPIHVGEKKKRKLVTPIIFSLKG